MPAGERIFDPRSEQHLHFLRVSRSSRTRPSHFAASSRCLLASQAPTGWWIMELSLEEGGKLFFLCCDSLLMYMVGTTASVTSTLGLVKCDSKSSTVGKETGSYCSHPIIFCINTLPKLATAAPPVPTEPAPSRRRPWPGGCPTHRAAAEVQFSFGNMFSGIVSETSEIPLYITEKHAITLFFFFWDRKETLLTFHKGVPRLSAVFPISLPKLTFVHQQLQG